MEERLTNALSFSDLSKKERFRLQTALDGLRYVQKVRRSFVPHTAVYELPHLDALIGLVHQLVVEQAPEPLTLREFVEKHVADHFPQIQTVFSSEAGAYESEGVFVDSSVGKQFVDNITGLIEEGEGNFTSKLTHPKIRIIRNMMRDYITSRYIQPINPFIESLFMGVRGHCPKGQLNNPKVAHAKACADGVYLDFMRALAELPQMADLAAGMHAVSVINCDRSILPSRNEPLQSATVSPVVLGGVQESLEDQRSVRADTDSRYAASMRADEERAQGMEETEAPAQEEEAHMSEATPLADSLPPRPTREELRNLRLQFFSKTGQTK